MHRRTGQADLPHPALGQDLTPSPTARRGQSTSISYGKLTIFGKRHRSTGEYKLQLHVWFLGGIHARVNSDCCISGQNRPWMVRHRRDDRHLHFRRRFVGQDLLRESPQHEGASTGPGAAACANSLATQAKRQPQLAMAA
jgi:hypothetical protein